MVARKKVKEDVVSMHLKIPKELWKFLKIDSASSETPMRSTVIHLLERYKEKKLKKDVDTKES